MSEKLYLKNQFLLAMPSLDNHIFSKTVTLICDHNKDGALGIVVNKPTNLNLAEVFAQQKLDIDQIEITDVPVHFGGPVNTQHGLVLHNQIGNWEYTLPISDQLALTTSKDILPAIASGQGPDNYIFILGYAGWDAGQLEKEIQENSWLIVPSNQDIIFNTPLNQRWHKAAQLSGIDLGKLSSQVGHA